MKCVLLSLFLTGAIVSAPTALDLTPGPNVLGEVSATLQSTAAFQAEQDEVHAVVVDMPEVINVVGIRFPRDLGQSTDAGSAV